jgi:hypothetical protein
MAIKILYALRIPIAIGPPESFRDHATFNKKLHEINR